jgi:hypothetical protein
MPDNRELLLTALSDLDNFLPENIPVLNNPQYKEELEALCTELGLNPTTFTYQGD